MTQTLDATIEQVENLYQSVTGHKAPPTGATAYAEIPPEKDAEKHVGEQIERLLSSLTQIAQRPADVARWAPALWSCYQEGTLVLNLDLPGVSRDAVRVHVTNGALQVSGTRTHPAVGNATAPCYAEQPFGVFQRWIPIPADVAADQGKAELRDGVLTVQLPRSAKSAIAGREITVS